jgi:hypothetical protein
MAPQAGRSYPQRESPGGFFLAWFRSVLAWFRSVLAWFRSVLAWFRSVLAWFRSVLARSAASPPGRPHGAIRARLSDALELCRDMGL